MAAMKMSLKGSFAPSVTPLLSARPRLPGAFSCTLDQGDVLLRAQLDSDFSHVSMRCLPSSTVLTPTFLVARLTWSLWLAVLRSKCATSCFAHGPLANFANQRSILLHITAPFTPESRGRHLQVRSFDKTMKQPLSMSTTIHDAGDD